ncbi:MAG: hypothetical protein M0R46_07875 [Candidatus Muirbacterium halophilum]|nr:hypothetical protein [Candidatus Muirbacterium halophilum]MCK9475819.1 hypothetical protein [Candidatus Muirbacterium halophilum]
MKKLAFVFKGSMSQGFGHVARTAYIYKNLNNVKCYFLFNGDKNLLNNLFDSNVFYFENEIELIEKLKFINADWVIFDRQKNPLNTILSVRTDKTKTFIIEDEDMNPQNTDILWDANKNFASDIDNFYTGAKNFILNPIIENYCKNKINKKTNSIFISLGGTDVRENIPFLIKNLKDKYFLNILPGIRYNEYLKYKGLNVNILNNKTIFYDFAQKSDIGIVSGGITMYEFVKMNIPTLVWPQVHHQIKSVEQLEKLKIVKKIAYYNNTVNKIIDFAENYKERHDLFINMKKFEIGHGFKKVKKILEET